jgi:hypothetical protein
VLIIVGKLMFAIVATGLFACFLFYMEEGRWPWNKK